MLHCSLLLRVLHPPTPWPAAGLHGQEGEGERQYRDKEEEDGGIGKGQMMEEKEAR